MHVFLHLNYCKRAAVLPDILFVPAFPRVATVNALNLTGPSHPWKRFAHNCRKCAGSFSDILTRACVITPNYCKCKYAAVLPDLTIHGSASTHSYCNFAGSIPSIPIHRSVSTRSYRKCAESNRTFPSMEAFPHLFGVTAPGRHQAFPSMEVFQRVVFFSASE